jgi:hypothetical protein
VNCQFVQNIPRTSHARSVARVAVN